MNRISLSLTALLMLACAADEQPTDTSIELDPELPITISVSTTTTTLESRGAMVTESKDMVSLSLFCALTGDAEWDSGIEFDKYSDHRFTLSEEGEWQADNESNKSWGYNTPSDNYTVFAYSPHYSDSDGITANIIDGELSINYTVPSNSADQPDLLLAKPRKDFSPQVLGSIPLDFYHALASISFGVVSATDTQITSIEITGVTSSGTLTWSDTAPYWEPNNTTQTFTIDMVNDYTLDSDNYAQLNSDEGYLMMIPQVLTNGATVTITLDYTDVQELTIPKNTTWLAGARYHYNIALSEEEDCDFIYNNNQISNCYIIHPTVGEKTIVQIPIETRINDYWQNHSGEKCLKLEAGYNIANYDITMLWEDFDEAFTTNNNFEYTMLDDDDGLLAVRFEFPADFQEGNFIFAFAKIKNGLAYCLWTWHLWFTDYDPDAIAKAFRSQITENKEMICSLDDGKSAVHRYVDADPCSSTAVWNGAYSNKFIMDRNIGERNSYAENSGAGTLFYQFGRPTPIAGTGSSSGFSGKSQTSTTFIISMIYANCFLFSNNTTKTNWCGETVATEGYKTNIWYDSTTDASDYETKKSIFDPSPLGWRIPVKEAWSSFNASYTSNKKEAIINSYRPYGWRDPTNSCALTQVGGAAYLWSANAYGPNLGYCKCIYDDGTYCPSDVNAPEDLFPTEVQFLSAGLSVRAIEE
ncbi:MAG: fimbrillin family protein [Rikenellaceae bacterium]